MNDVGESQEVARRKGAETCKAFYDELVAVGLPLDAANGIVAHWFAAATNAQAQTNGYQAMVEVVKEFTKGLRDLD